MTASTTLVDAHVHVFRPAGVVPRTVDTLAPADRDAPVEDLIDVLDRSGVDRAVLVPLGPEATYVSTVLASHPGRFTAIAVADPDVQGRTSGLAPVAALRRRQEGLAFAGLRTQWLGEPGRDLADSPMLPTLRHLAATGLVLWSYVTPDQLGLVEQAAALPDLTIVLNHLGLCPRGMWVDADGRPGFDDPFPGDTLDRVVALAAHPGVNLMFSGQYAMSRQPPPYPELMPVVRRLADAYGAQRMLWASDYPWTRDVPGHRRLLALPGEMLPDASATELAAITGGTALRLLRHLRPEREG